MCRFKHPVGAEYLASDKRIARLLDLVARCLTNVGNTPSEKQKVQMISSALLLNAASAIASITKRDSQALISPESEEESDY